VVFGCFFLSRLNFLGHSSFETITMDIFNFFTDDLIDHSLLLKIILALEQRRLDHNVVHLAT
jgi:hypothetical protein